MRKATGLFFAICFLVSFLTGCDKVNFLTARKTLTGKKAVSQEAPAVTGTVIAKVNNAPVVLEELEEEVSSYNMMVPEDKPEAKISTREQKIDYLKNEMIRRKLLYQEALAKGLDRKDEVVRVLEKTKQDLLVVELIKAVAEEVDATSQEIEDYYNTYKDQLKEPEERQIREIVAATEPEAKDIMIQLLQGADFATLARDRSIAPSKDQGGDLGFVQPGQRSAQFDAAAFSDTLEAGRISSIFKDAGGYSILKLERKRGGGLKSLSEMWDDIKRGLTFLKQQQKIQDLVGALSRQAKIEIYEGEIK